MAVQQPGQVGAESQAGQVSPSFCARLGQPAGFQVQQEGQIELFVQERNGLGSQLSGEGQAGLFLGPVAFRFGGGLGGNG